LLKPLSLQQVAPLGYMAAELTAIKLFGFSEWSLRLFAVIASVSGMFLFRDLAARTMDKMSTVLAVGVLAVSYYPIRHAAECKPYGSDLTAALLLAWLAVRWWQSPTKSRWLWALAVAGPLMITISNPTIFVAGGVSLALALPVWRSRDRAAWAAFATYNVLVAAVFLLMLRSVTAAQYAATHEFMHQYWAEGFPPFRPLAFLGWLATIHAGEMMAYPVGDDHFGSILTLACFIVGVIVLVRRRDRTLAVLVLGPLALAFVGAALKRYPYGGARLSQWYGALACLAIGLGLATVLASFARPEARRRAFHIAVAVLMVIGAVTLVRDVTKPYKRLVDFEHRGFVRWFWKENCEEGQVVCVHTDLGKRFTAAQVPEDYLCYQRAYSPVHGRGGRTIDLAALPVDRPLRCVACEFAGEARDEAAFRAWMDEMSTLYELTSEQTYKVRLNHPPEPSRHAVYTVFEFRAHRR
jgi:4-amino-4-deoxy-L-arabinose transferase-like glycosyltransferase